MNSPRDNCEDWIIRAQRGGLSESEQRQFRELIAGSSEARLLYEAGRAFDRESCVMAGDDARLERIARQLQKRRTRHKRWVPIRRLSFGVAAAILVAGAAVGAVSYSRSLRIGTGEVPEAAQGVRSKPAAALHSMKGHVEAAPVPTPILPPVTSPESTPPAEVPRAPASRSAQLPGLPPSPLPVASSTSPALAPSDLGIPGKTATGRFDDIAEVPEASASALALFTEANQARVRGDTARALSRYSQLLSTFPRSREARAARISMGVLYLQQGRPEQALEQFRTYRADTGPLAAEALWGEAQALRSLGLIQDERRTLERIVRDYPQSAYAPPAQRRLNE